MDNDNLLYNMNALRGGYGFVEKAKTFDILDISGNRIVFQNKAIMTNLKYEFVLNQGNIDLLKNVMNGSCLDMIEFESKDFNYNRANFVLLVGQNKLDISLKRI